MIFSFINSRFFLVLLLPLILGSLTVFSFQPYNFSYINFLIIPSLFLLTIYVQKKSKNRFRNKPYLLNLFLIGYLFGVGFFLAGTHWISYSLTFDDSFEFLIPISVVGLPLFLGLFFGFGNLIIGPFLQKNFVSIIVFSSILSFMDYLRAIVLSGFPWNLWAYSLSWLPEVLQLLPLIGFYTFNMICIIVYAAPLLLFFENRKKNLSIFVIFLFFLLGNFIYGSTIIKNNSANLKKNLNNSVFIKIVSPNFDLKYNLSDSDIRKVISELIKFSDPKKGKSTLFVWPEGVFSGYEFEEIKKYSALFERAFSDEHLIIFGSSISSAQGKNLDVFNSMIVVNNKLEIINRYDKQKLVPFGEFLPLEKYLKKVGLKKITEGYGSFQKGESHKVFLIDKLKILPLICYEIIFPELGKKISKNIIVNISEDAWFGNSIGPHQHFAKSIFRAVESNVFLIRSANKGISAFVNNKGVVIKSLKPSETGAMGLNVPIINNSNLKHKINLIFFVLLFTHIIIFILCRKKT